MSEEEWRPIPSHDGHYEVSNFGRVRSLPRTYNLGHQHLGIMHNAGGVLRASLIGGRSELRVSLGNTKGNVKRLVWEAFNGPLPEKTVLICEDGDHTNASLTNLRLITRAELLRMNTGKL